MIKYEKSKNIANKYREYFITPKVAQVKSNTIRTRMVVNVLNDGNPKGTCKESIEH